MNFLQVINGILPQLAKRKMDAVITEVHNACFKLGITPTATTEYINSLTFLEEIQARVRVKHYCLYHPIMPTKCSL